MRMARRVNPLTAYFLGVLEKHHGFEEPGPREEEELEWLGEEDELEWLGEEDEEDEDD